MNPNCLVLCSIVGDLDILVLLLVCYNGRWEEGEGDAAKFSLTVI